MSLICWGCGFDCDSASDFYWNCRCNIERSCGRRKGEAAGSNLAGSQETRQSLELMLRWLKRSKFPRSTKTVVVVEAKPERAA